MKCQNKENGCTANVVKLVGILKTAACIVKVTNFALFVL